MNTDKVNEAVDELQQVIDEIIDNLSHNERIAFTNAVVQGMVQALSIAALKPEEDRETDD